MADNTKDVALNLKVAASGNEQVKALADQLQALAKQGGDAAPKLQALGEELAQIGAKSDALLAFGKLEEEIAQASAAIDTQRKDLGQLREAYDAQSKSTQELRDKQVQAADALGKTESELRATVAQMRLLKSGQTELTEGTDRYDARLDQLNKDLAILRNARAEEAVSLKAANAELKQSETALKSVSDQYTRAAKAAEQNEQAIRAQREQLDQARTAMNATGVAATTLAEATKEVDAAFEAVRQRTQTLVAEEERLQSIGAAVAASNERNAALAQRAADARTAAAKETAAAERAAADASDAAALKQRLALEGIEANIKAARAEAQALADRLQQALAVTGAKSAQQLRLEINDVRSAMEFLRTSSELTGRELNAALADGSKRINQLERDLREATGQLTLMDRAAGLFKSTVGQFTAGFLIAQAVQQLAVGALEANKNLELLQRGLKAVYGDAGVAAKQIQFLKDTANTAGLSFNGIAASFVQFSASMKSAGYSVDLTQKLFRGLSNEAANLGLSIDKVKDIINALGQIAGKGTAQLEELKGQLGDALPGALKRTADALGITVPQMLALAEKGQLLADDVLPALGNAFDKPGAAATTFEAVLARVKNTLSEVATQVGDTGAWDALKTVLLLLSSLFAGLGNAVQLTVDGIVTGVRKAAVLVGGFVRGDLKNALTEADRLNQEFIDRQVVRSEKLQATLKQNYDSYQAIVGSQTQLAVSAEQAGAKSEAAGNQIAAAGAKSEAAGAQHAAAAAGVQANATAQTQAASAATSNAQAQGVSGSAATAAGTQAAKSGSLWTQLAAAYVENTTAIKNQVKVAEIAVETAKNHASAIERVAKLTGDQRIELNAAAQAAQKVSVATQDLAEKEQAHANILKAERDALAEAARVQGDVNGNRAKAIAALDQEILKVNESAAKYRAAADAQQADSEQKRLAAEIYKDNSARLVELSKAADDSQAALSRLAQAFADDAISAETFNRGAQRAATDLALYRDALNDVAKAIDRKYQLEQVGAKTAQTLLQTELEKAKAAEASAKAYGNETAALQAQLTQKDIEAKLIASNINLKNQEIAAEQGHIQTLEAQKAKLGELTPEQEQELKLRKANVEAMKAEIANSKAKIDSINQETDAIKNRNAAQAGSFSGSTDKGGGAQSTLKRGGPLADQNGFAKDTAGNTINAGGETWISILNQLKSYGLDDAKAKAVANEFIDAQGNVPFFNNPGQAKYGGPYSTLSYAIQKAAQQALNTTTVGGGGSGSGSSLGGGSSNPTQGSINAPTLPTPSVSPSSAGGNTSHTVNINLGGSAAGSVNVASAADADKLTAILQQIGSAAQRAI